ncbi:MAG TPA: biopolymer transporter ExbD [Ideonella sp.]|uniref:ExbD/TolR family protein n=1 Tax=Ideonella sp. TaxID=1929293 RepID=UPI002E32C81E|nr:biopolymer transporter ExbD [Ideonella sp.]HEX5687080.1 biopolymer transporter ExbD [Ideonella sp.]
MRVRRLKKHPAALEISAFLNLIVVLVPFLLSTAVFTRLTVVDMSLPAQSTGAAEQLQVDHLNLEVVIRPDAIEVGDRIGGLIQRIANTDGSTPDLVTLNALVTQIKLKFPEQRDASVLAEPDTSYDKLVKVMDAVRSTQRSEGGQVVRSELFPDIAIGDAPVVRVKP